MKNHIVIAVLIGLITASAFGGQSLTQWISRTFYPYPEIKRLEDKLRAELYQTKLHDSRAPSNMKLHDVEKLWNNPYRELPAIRGEYVYQKPGLNKQGKEYAPRRLGPDASQRDIRREIAERRARARRLEEKVNYLEADFIRRAWMRDAGLSPYHQKFVGKPVKNIDVYEQWKESAPMHIDESYLED